jgi:hypothetical protein
MSASKGKADIIKPMGVRDFQVPEGPRDGVIVLSGHLIPHFPHI